MRYRVELINPKKIPFFYGWIIIFAGTVGVIISVPGQTMGVSVFTDYLIDGWKLNRLQLSQAYGIGTICSALFLTKAGRFYDKHGVLKTSVIASIILALILLFLPYISNISFFISKQITILSYNTVAFFMASFGFFVLRFSGQGVLTMTSRNMVMKWFNKRRGLASAFMGIATSFAFSYSPQIIDLLIKEYTWQGAWIHMSIFIFAVFIVFQLIFFKDNPQKYSLLPDGKLSKVKRKTTPIYKPIKEYNLKEAKRTFSFWIFNLSLAMVALFYTALTFHIVSIFEEAEIDRSVALLIFLPSSVIAVFFQLVFGYLADYIKIKFILVLEIFGLILSSIGVMFLSEGFFYWLVILGNGIAIGLYNILLSVTWPRFYGTKYLGEISGFNMSFIIAGSAIGPLFFGLSQKYTGSYFYSTFLCLAALFILLILSFKANKVNEKKN